MRQHDTISVVEHNDFIARSVLLALETNEGAMSVDFYLSDMTMRLFRELRGELHPNTEYRSRGAARCECTRCGRKSRSRKRKKVA